MRYLLLTLALTFVNIAHAVTECEIYGDDAISDITNLAVPNCISDDNIFSENDAKRSNPKQAGPICGSCRQKLDARVSITAEDKKRLKKQAYLETMYSEFEKAMTSASVEIVAMRKLFSTGSEFNQSQNKCNPSALSQKMSRCGQEQKDFLSNKNFASRFGATIAEMITGEKASNAILSSSTENQCSLTGQNILSLKPLLLEESITPQLVQKLAALNVSKPEDIWIAVNEGNFGDLFNHHPLFKTLIESPKDFTAFF
ncbi:MAG: hypothetical protein ACJ76H_07630, partial [Bacteriovoracaceae bacterium]